MIGIAILDDDSRVREALNAHLTRFARREGLELQIRSFESGREFLETDYSAFDMLISDIQMPAMNGIDVARSVREIQTVQQQDIRLLSGALIPLSKHRKKALKERLTVFWGDQFL